MNNIIQLINLLHDGPSHSSISVNQDPFATHTHNGLPSLSTA